MEILGVPAKELIDRSSRRKLFFDSNYQPRITANSRGKRRRPNTKDLATAIRCNDAMFLDFLTQCLQWDPEERMTPDKALAHEWILEGKASARQMVPRDSQRRSTKTKKSAATT